MKDITLKLSTRSIVLENLEKQEILERVRAEILILPRKQRIALLAGFDPNLIKETSSKEGVCVRTIERWRTKGVRQLRLKLGDIK